MKVKSYRLEKEDGEDYPSILEALDDLRVLRINKIENGEFEVTEMCDEYFSAFLTRDQLLLLVEEIKRLS